MQPSKQGTILFGIFGVLPFATFSVHEKRKNSNNNNNQELPMQNISFVIIIIQLTMIQAKMGEN